MRKILAAFDGSEGAELALRDMARAGYPARAEGRIVSIADVWIPLEPLGGIINEQLSFQTAQTNAKVMLEMAEKEAEKGASLLRQLFPGWSISTGARADSPAWGIMAEAKSWNADLLVIGSHGRSGLERFFLGSVSYKVAAEAACSVRVSRPGAKESSGPPHVMIGVDGSQESQRAVGEALERDWPSGTEVSFVTVVDSRVKSRVLGWHEFFEPQKQLNRVEDWIEPKFEEYQASFAKKGLKAKGHILEGDPKTSLLRQAEMWKADCIFMGARGLDHGERLYLGTLASAVCTRAHCTVEIIRAPASSPTA